MNNEFLLILSLLENNWRGLDLCVSLTLRINTKTKSSQIKSFTVIILLRSYE